MGRQWGVLFKVRHLMLEPLEAVWLGRSSSSSLPSTRPHTGSVRRHGCWLAAALVLHSTSATATKSFLGVFPPAPTRHALMLCGLFLVWQWGADSQHLKSMWMTFMVQFATDVDPDCRKVILSHKKGPSSWKCLQEV